MDECEKAARQFVEAGEDAAVVLDEAEQVHCPAFETGELQEGGTTLC